MLALKEYQQRALDVLRSYYQRCVQEGDADAAFYLTTRDTFSRGISYRPAPGLHGLPYACIRIPTGGGKTLIAAHAIGITEHDLLHNEHSVVLWLVPSNAILTQTIDALKDKRHPYRQALESSCGSVTVLNVGEALSLTRATLDTSTTVIVATMQAFRVEETEGRKVYDDAGSLMTHFDNLPPSVLERLVRFEDGTPHRSLENVLRLRRPAVIVDEAHNARTDLSFETLARFDPACILELTATPASGNHASNVLYSVSAAELKAEEMIKLPIRLATRSDWRQLLGDAVNLRAHLEELAVAERLHGSEYIRPIMLLQAEKSYKNRESLNIDVVEQSLIDDWRIPEEQIARATGTDRQLDGVDLNDPKCPVRFVITVQALREGWDCPFAYVLCSVAESRSSTAVEQILGRVLRMPYAKRRANEELNCAYAFVASSTAFAGVASSLADALVQNGFERQEAEQLIEQGQSREDMVTGLPLWQDWHQVVEPGPPKHTTNVSQPPSLGSLPPTTAAKIIYEPKSSSLTFTGPMNEADLAALQGCFDSPRDKTAVVQLFERSQLYQPDRRPPSNRGHSFSIPVLSIRQGDIFEQLEETHLLEVMPGLLTTCMPMLDEQEYSLTQTEYVTGEIDVDAGGKVKTRFIGALHEQMALLDANADWTIAELARWLDLRLPDRAEIPLDESSAFLVKLLQNLERERGISQGALVGDKYRLLNAIVAHMKTCSDTQRTTAMRQLLSPDLLDGMEVVVTPESCFTYPHNEYPYNRLYRGSLEMPKHYYPEIGDFDTEEEKRYAHFLATQPEVETWVRNLERRPRHSFWLQTSTDRFYPDFVCKLIDGRYLVVEYKGAHLWSNADSEEKRAIGELWAARSNGACLFTMPQGPDFNAVRSLLTN